MVLPDSEFVSQIADAYQHLYDLVHLRRHPLAALLISDTRLPPQERAWQLHQILLDAIQALDPGPKVPLHSREWRRHRLMVLRYLEGLEVRVVADELGISKRHYFREHDAAIEAIADVLANNTPAQWGKQEEKRPADSGGISLSRLELLRLEAARVARSSRQLALNDVVQGVVGLVQNIAQQRGIKIAVSFDPLLPRVVADSNTLRQLFLGLLNLLLNRLAEGEVAITGRVEEGQIVVHLCGSWIGSEAAGPLNDQEALQLSLLGELAAVQGVQIRQSRHQDRLGFRLEFPLATARTVLVIDDNEEAARLLELVLARRHYQVVTAYDGAEAIERARELQPFAITLDLMMPERDGWEVLQTLTNQPATQHIPVIVCSVLAAEQLALSLGATAFLPKPINEQSLLTILSTLE
jgi:CheY-like chemotaxis protein